MSIFRGQLRHLLCFICPHPSCFPRNLSPTKHYSLLVSLHLLILYHFLRSQEKVNLKLDIQQRKIRLLNESSKLSKRTEGWFFSYNSTDSYLFNILSYDPVLICWLNAQDLQFSVYIKQNSSVNAYKGARLPAFKSQLFPSLALTSQK